MKLARIYIIILCLFILRAEAVASVQANKYIQDEIIVKFKSNINISEENRTTSSPSVNKLFKNHNITRISKLFKNDRTIDDLIKIKNKFPKRAARVQQETNNIPDISNIYKIKIPIKSDIQSIIQEYKNNPNVEYAEPNYICQKSSVPNDPYYSSYGSWGQNYDDLWGLKIISAQAAWNAQTGSSDVVVAVIDTGIDYNHEDISANIWANSGEIPNNGLDDDGDGLIDDVKGWNYVNNNNDPMDDNGHGTYIAGTIAAVGNNWLGITGVSWNSKIMNLRVLGQDGNGSTNDVAAAIVFAANNGADIINLGLGTYDNPRVLSDAIDYAYGLGCVLISAAGNDNSGATSYPAGYEKVISVAATNHNDQKADFSNWGQTIDVSAPGGDSPNEVGENLSYNILSLKSTTINPIYNNYIVNSKYLRARGTSMAAAYVSGLAALILSNFSDLSQKGVKDIVCTTADDKGDPGWDQYYGYGRINAYKALLKSSEMKSKGVVGYITLPLNGVSILGDIEIKGQAFGSKFQSYKVEYGAGITPTNWVELTNSIAPITNGKFCTWDTTSIINGVYKLKLTVTGTDASTFEDTVLVSVINPIVSVKSGQWSDSATWKNGTIPSSMESVIISSGHTVLFDRNDASITCGSVSVESNGVLKMDSSLVNPKTMQINGNIYVYGKLEILPYSTLKIEGAANGQHGINVYSGGEFKGNGSVPTFSTILISPVYIGDNSIIVADISGFGVGDVITVGSGVSAEGFKISGIIGNQILLSRKTLNAQVSGADVYKNATVSVSDISAGSNKIIVSNLGGIKAGDKVLISKNPTGYYGDEIFNVDSVDLASNSISISGAFNYSHPQGSLAIKLNRDCKITSGYPYYGNKYYFVVCAGAKIQLDCVEVENVVENMNDNTYGFTIRSSINCNVIRSSLHDGTFGLCLGAGCTGVNLISNAIYRNNEGIIMRGDGGKANIISNVIFLNNGNGIELEDLDGGRNYVFSNIIFSNSYGLSCIFSNSPNIFIYNDIFSSSCYGVSTGLGTIYAHNNIKKGSLGGVYLGNNNSLLIKNVIENNNNAGINSYWDYRNIVADCLIINNAGYDISLRKELSVKNCRYNVVSIDKINDGYGLIQKPKGDPGVSVYGDYHISSSEDKKYDYSSQSYPSYASIPILFRGTNHTISTPEANDATTTTEVWFITYRTATSNWEVKGTVSGLQVNRATSGVLYTSDNGQIKFTLTQAAGMQEGDQFVFVTIAAAGDANTQKKILFGPSAIAGLNNQSRLVVDPGCKLELKGTPAYPTLISAEGTSGYSFIISGEVEAQNFNFNQISGEGVKFTPTATITKFDNGSLYNVSDTGSHMTVDGIDHTFNYLNFDETGNADVKALNNANLVFTRSQRGKFVDQIFDTSSVAWDDPVLGYTQPQIIGAITYDANSKVLTIPFKIKDPNSLTCTYEANSFQYSTDGGSTWNSAADSNLSGIGSIFTSNANFSLAPENKIYWNTGTNYSNLEANLAVRFRVNNGYVYGDYGSSEAIPFNIVPPVVNVLSPNGGEVLKGGGSKQITWMATDAGSGVASNSIAIYYNIGAGDVLIANNLPNSGSYTWTAPVINTTEAKIKITARDNVNAVGQDSSDATFTIDSIPPVAPTINTVKTPTMVNSQTITGTKTADSANILVNGSSNNVTLPTTTTWTTQVTVSKGSNSINISAADIAGNQSSPAVAVIEGADKIFTDSASGASVKILFGAASTEIDNINFDLITLLASPPRGAAAVGKALKISSVVNSLSLPAEITLPKPAGGATYYCYIWSAALSKWRRMSVKTETPSSFGFNSDNFGTYAVFEIIDKTPPSINYLKVNGRNMANGDSITSNPAIQADITDDYGVDDSQTQLSLDGAPTKSLNINSQNKLDVSISGTVAEGAGLSIGNHAFKLLAADEVGNTSSREVTLFVVGDSIPGLLIYPNPYKLGSAGGTKFDGLTEDIKVRVYDIAGDLTWTGQNIPGSASLTWNAVNSSGNQLTPGVYFYVATSTSGGKSSGKIAIIR